MDRLFLDTNCVYDLLYKRDLSYSSKLDTYSLSLSALSFHIAFYLAKEHMPQEWLNEFLTHFKVVPLDEHILSTSSQGPTNDFEDNIQLNSALETQAIIFCTKDKGLLALKTFQGFEIKSPNQI